MGKKLSKVKSALSKAQRGIRKAEKKYRDIQKAYQKEVQPYLRKAGEVGERLSVADLLGSSTPSEEKTESEFTFGTPSDVLGLNEIMQKKKKKKKE